VIASIIPRAICAERDESAAAGVTAGVGAVATGSGSSVAGGGVGVGVSIATAWAKVSAPHSNEQASQSPQDKGESQQKGFLLKSKQSLSFMEKLVNLRFHYPQDVLTLYRQLKIGN
jgi:hypothetical protein